MLKQIKGSHKGKKKPEKLFNKKKHGVDLTGYKRAKPEIYIYIYIYIERERERERKRKRERERVEEVELTYK